jgi:hypothetical protein
MTESRVTQVVRSGTLTVTELSVPADVAPRFSLKPIFGAFCDFGV